MRELKSTRALTLCTDREYQYYKETADDLHRLLMKSHTSSADSKHNQINRILNSQVVATKLLFPSST